MIFTTFSYFLFLIPTALLFRLSGPRLRPWICVASGVAFFVYFSVTGLAGWIGAACVASFVWESLISRLYTPGSRWCVFGVAASVSILVAFKYWNFLTGLVTTPAGINRWAWRGAFLPLGISFFGRAYSEPMLLKIAYGFEQATKARMMPQFVSSIG